MILKIRMIENKMKKFIIGSINLYCGHLLPECGVWAPVIHQLREFHKVSRLIISAVTAADVWRVLITPEETQSLPLFLGRRFVANQRRSSVSSQQGNCTIHLWNPSENSVLSCY